MLESDTRAPPAPATRPSRRVESAWPRACGHVPDPRRPRRFACLGDPRGAVVGPQNGRPRPCRLTGDPRVWEGPDNIRRLPLQPHGVGNPPAITPSDQGWARHKPILARPSPIGHGRVPKWMGSRDAAVPRPPARMPAAAGSRRPASGPLAKESLPLVAPHLARISSAPAPGDLMIPRGRLRRRQPLGHPVHHRALGACRAMLCDAVSSRRAPRRLMAPIRFRLVVAPTPRITGGSGKANRGTPSAKGPRGSAVMPVPHVFTSCCHGRLPVFGSSSGSMAIGRSFAPRHVLPRSFSSTRLIRSGGWGATRTAARPQRRTMDGLRG
jgi:hypothetical protein